MKATIVNFRGGRHTQYNNQMIVKVEGSSQRKDAEKLVGRQVLFTTVGKNKKQICGKIASPHGNSGAVRIIFETGMPGQAFGKEVAIR